MAEVAAPLGCCCCVGAGVWKLRHSIQGYWLDKRCPASCAGKDLSGKVALVTGATAGGLGCAAAEHLARRGAKVVLTCRSEAKAREAQERVARAAGAAAGGETLLEKVEALLVDFESRASVAQAGAKFKAGAARLDLLVLNAGIADGPPDVMWQTNHVGPFLLAEALMPLLEATAKESGDVRVVAVSSGAHKRASLSEAPYDSDGPYGQSKLAQILHMRELQKRFRAKNAALPPSAFRCLSITPGFATTNLPSGPLAKRPCWQRAAARCLMPLLGRSPEMGAEVIAMACLDDSLEGGEYLSNCYVKPAEGKDGCANSEAEWARCWRLTEACAADGRFS